MKKRTANLTRETRETKIQISVDLDGSRHVNVKTGLGFFDHMITALGFHAGWNLELIAEGDLHIDDHHTIEDCGIVLGQAIDSACGDKTGIRRFASAYAPLDESLARAVLDFSGRSAAVIELGLVRETIGNVATENLSHFFGSMASAGNFAIHLDILRGENDHHRAEAAFKAAALAFREALAIDSYSTIPSTKGVI